MKQLGIFIAAFALIWPVSSYASDPAICAGAHYIWVEQKNAEDLERDLKQREIEIEGKKIELNEIIRFKLRYAKNVDVKDLSHAYEGMSFWISNAHSSCQRMPPFPQEAEHIFHVDDMETSRQVQNDLKSIEIKYQIFISDNVNETVFVFKNEKNEKIYPVILKFTKGYYGNTIYALGVNLRNSNDDGDASLDTPDSQ